MKLSSRRFSAFVNVVSTVILISAICLLSNCNKSEIPQRPIVITDFLPVNGNEGTYVTINGSGFSTALTGNAVDFNGTPATVTLATTTSIEAIVPKNVTSGKINITVNGKTGSTIDDFKRVLIVKTFTGMNGKGFANGTLAGAKFDGPAQLIINSAGTIFVSEDNNSAIRMITTSGEVTNYAGDALTNGYMDGDAANARFEDRLSMALDASGNMLVGDYYNYCLRKISSQKSVTTLAGNHGNSGYLDGQGTAAKFYTIFTLAIDGSGNTFVSDYQNNRIRKITSSGDVSTFAGDGTFGYQDGPGVSAKFGDVWGMVFDSAGNLFVCDQSVHRIRKISPDGTVTTFAGGERGNEDGNGVNAKFNYPAFIATDSKGNFYVTDIGNHNVRKITPAGIVTTVVKGGLGYADGRAEEARFSHPWGLVVSPDGKIYVADRDNNRIAVILPE